MPMRTVLGFVAYVADTGTGKPTILKGAQGKVYSVNDVGLTTPLACRDLATETVIPNPTSNEDGYIAGFKVNVSDAATGILWTSGEYPTFAPFSNLVGEDGKDGSNVIPAAEAIRATVESDLTNPASASASTVDGLITGRTVGIYAPINDSTVKIGVDALSAQPAGFDVGANGTVVALGTRAMEHMEDATNAIAIGTNAQGEGTHSRENIAIGDSALQHVQATKSNYDQNAQEGTRNIGIGGNSLRFNKSGQRHIAIGRNAGHCVEDGMGLVAIGVGANGGQAPIGLSGEVENWAKWGEPGQRIRATAVGLEASARSTAPNNVAVGGDALSENKKSDNNVAVGARALFALDSGTGVNGGTYHALDATGTYTQTGTTLTIGVEGHSMKPGDIAYFRMTDGGSKTFANDVVLAYVGAVVDVNTFTIVHPLTIEASGAAVLYGRETAAKNSKNEGNTALGTSAAASLKAGGGNTAIGQDAFGSATSGDNGTSIGNQSMSKASSTKNSAAVGFYAAGNMVGNPAAVTALGSSALRNKTDGSALTDAWSNIIGIGYDSRVSGANQAQIGNTSVTTYTYGAVQNRSDKRDKADIRDTKLGLDFIEKLRPVDYRWDMRDDYFTEDEEGNLAPIPKDGSKKRKRYHQGLIAQEVQEVITETGVDFGGFQDHKVGGGSDVLSIGYEELIAPLVKAVQELSSRVAALEGAGSNPSSSSLTKSK